MTGILIVGDIEDDEELLDWLTDPTNMEMTDHIERVNRKMFEKIRQTSDYVAVFFCEFIFFNNLIPKKENKSYTRQNNELILYNLPRIEARSLSDLHPRMNLRVGT